LIREQLSLALAGEQQSIRPMDPDSEVQHDFYPIVRQYKSGRVVRFGTANPVPAGTDTAGTGVSSRDVVINSSSGLWARLYLPPLPAGSRDKLPVIMYYDGGAFVIGSTADEPTHEYLNSLAAGARALVVSAEYRRAPEHPLPAAHDDSWEALEWVASHAAAGAGAEPWLAAHGDLSRVFLAGFSAGGNIAHAMAARAGARSLGVPIGGLLLIHPYFIGEAPVGPEATDAALKAWADAFWRFVRPGAAGPDDPLGNPFSEAAGGSAARLAAGRVLVCVAEVDALRGRGVWYYESLRASGYGGEVELHESAGEDHVFHYTKPGCEQARLLHARVLRFLRGECL
jgi:acetyl esterase/lipase